MRLNRGTLSLFLVSIAVIIVVLLLNNNRANAPDVDATPTPTVSGPLFPDVQQDAIVSLEVVDSASGDHTLLTRDADNVWSIEATNSADRAPDQTKVTNSVRSLVSLRSTDQFGPNDVEGFDLASYGLDEPTHTVSMSSTDGTLYTLYIGAKNPGGTRYYTRVEITPGAEATAEPDNMPDATTVYLVAQFELDNLIKLITEPPYEPTPTPTQTPFPTPNPISEVDQTATAVVEQTATAAATPELTPEATTEATTEATPSS